jgi:transposase
MLQHPNEVCYRDFFEQLYAIYQEGVRWQKDQRLSVGRPQKVESLQAKIVALCTRSGTPIDAEKMPLHEQTWIRLQNELVNGRNALFVFVASHKWSPPTIAVSAMCAKKQMYARVDTLAKLKLERSGEASS